MWTFSALGDSHRLTVGLVWLFITAVGVVLAPSVSGRLTGRNHFSSAAQTANIALARQYGGATSDPGVVMLDLLAGQSVHSNPTAGQLTGSEGWCDPTPNKVPWFPWRAGRGYVDLGCPVPPAMTHRVPYPLLTSSHLLSNL